MPDWAKGNYWIKNCPWHSRKGVHVGVRPIIPRGVFWISNGGKN